MKALGLCKICAKEFIYERGRNGLDRPYCSPECKKALHAAQSLASHHRKVIREEEKRQQRARLKAWREQQKRMMEAARVAE